MDYEKKYKEALANARQEYNTTKNVERKQWLEELFPELKESEDERIRKALICGMYALKDQHRTCFASIPIDNAIAWLEKQGEFYTKRDVDNAYIEGMAFAKDELEKQGEQKGYTFKSIPRLLDMIEPSDKAKAYCQKLIDTLVKEGYNTDAKIVEEVLKGWNGEDVPMAIMDEQKPVFEMKTPEESLGIDSDTYNKIVDECIYGEQKPTWSEEDECYTSECIGAIATKDGWSFEEKRKMKHWLESLKDRVQPKQEWSEDAERIYKSVLYAFEHNYPLIKEQQKFVKSLKERCTWKPSNEQICALAYALSLAKSCGEDYSFDLRTLYEQLKKLKKV